MKCLGLLILALLTGCASGKASSSAPTPQSPASPTPTQPEAHHAVKIFWMNDANLTKPSCYNGTTQILWTKCLTIFRVTDTYKGVEKQISPNNLYMDDLQFVWIPPDGVVGMHVFTLYVDGLDDAGNFVESPPISTSYNWQG